MLRHSWLQRLASAFRAPIYSSAWRRNKRQLPFGGSQSESLESRIVLVASGVTLSVALPTSVAEAAGASTVTATLSSVCPQNVTVFLGFSGTATNISDYTRTDTQIVIPAGSLSNTITLTAVQDKRVEINETIVIDITGVLNATESGTQQVTVTIIDDDTPDIVLNYATADGHQTLTVQYQISTAPVTVPLNLRFLRSTDALADVADNVLSTVIIDNPADLTVGSHTLNFAIGRQVLLPGAGRAEVSTDYFILAVADPTNTITETDSDSDPLNEDNTVAFVGAYAPSTAIYLHGGAEADVVALTYPATSSGNVTLGLSGSRSATYNYAYSQTSQFRLRTHGGHDTVQVGAVNPANLTARPTLELGGDGNDALVGGGGNDTLNGAAGDDLLQGGTGNDLLEGGEGNDLLEGGTGNDSLYAGTGDDGLHADIGNDVMDGGPGYNNLFALGDVNFVLTDFSLTGVGTDTLANLQAAYLTGGTSSNSFTVSAWTGGGTIDGARGLADRIVAVRDGDMTLTDTSLAAQGFGTWQLFGVETADLSSGTSGNVLNAEAFTCGGVTLRGGSRDDVLIGSAQNDSLVGGGGNDSLSGAAGNDTIVGNDGDDTIAGGTGHDTVVETADNNITLADTELVIGRTTDALSGIESANLTGGSGDNTLTASGFTFGGVTLSGGGGNDSLVGTNLSDSLNGGRGNDTLRGGSGHDTLDGGDGNDVLVGGPGRDQLIGGAGRDLLIGGVGADSLDGNAGDDILIGGTTSHDGNIAALNAIMAEWTSARNYAARVANLLNGGGANGSIRLNSTTVKDDSSAVDTLTGGADIDWFFLSNADVLIDFNADLSEIVTGI